MKKKSAASTAKSPLGEAVAVLVERLKSDGYAKDTVDQYASICRRFARHLEKKRVVLSSLTDEHVEAFLISASTGRGLRDGGESARRFWRSPLRHLMGQLRSTGHVAAVAEPAPMLRPGLVEYLTFLREHRGFCEATIERHGLYVGRFLDEVGARTEADIRGLPIEQVDRFLVGASRVSKRLSMGAICSSVRGFLGHLHMRGVLAVDLRAQVATPRLYSLEAMPRSVAWSDIERTFATIDRTTLQGVRDCAMLALVAHGGLRASEVAALRLVDIDWRTDRIRVRRRKKGTGPVDDVPIVPFVGEALVAYLRQRPSSPHGQVFLTIKAPISPIEGWLVSRTAATYLRLAGVKTARIGSHTLRHSFAVELLRRGHSLRAIGDVLGHRHPQSTFLYLKAAVEDLRDVALDLGAVLS